LPAPQHDPEKQSNRSCALLQHLEKAHNTLGQI